MKSFPTLLAFAALSISSLSAVSQTTAQAVSPKDAAATEPYAQPELPPRVQYFSLEHRSPAQMSPDDQAQLKARERNLEQEAEFYGYDLREGDWNYDQVLCPEIPDYVMLHYYNRDTRGAESLFTALIPKNGAALNRIRIVPVLYRNATPFHAAVKTQHSYDTFNAVVPAAIAKRAVDPQGSWLSYSACYAELVGGRPRIPNQPDLTQGTSRAPSPTIHMTVASGDREIVFADRDAENTYKVWTIDLNGSGRVTRGALQGHPVDIAHILNPPEPAPRMMPEGANPETSTSPPAPH